MTHDHSAALARLDDLKGADSRSVFAELIRSGLQDLIEAKVTERIGAGRYERAGGRRDRPGTTSRHDRRPVETSVEDVA